MANQIYDNVIIEKKFESVLASKLNFQNFLTVDNTLAEDAGMIKKIVKYSATGNVEDLAMGVGNTGYIETTVEEVPYEVGVTQGRFAYFDEQALRDDKVVEAGVTGLAETMTNDFISKAVAEYEKATKSVGYSTISFDTFVDAIAALNVENEDEYNLFALVNPAMQASLRKALKDDIKYVENFVSTGYIGHVCGVPLYISKAVPADTIYIAGPKAVTLFVKKGSEAEVSRDVNTRQTIQYLRKVALVALTDERYLVKVAKNPATTATITTKTAGAKAIGGAATTGAVVTVYVNGKLVGTVTAESNAWTINAEANLATGDVIKAVVVKTGEKNQVVEATV